MGICRFVPESDGKIRLGIDEPGSETVTAIDVGTDRLEATLRNGWDWSDFEAAEGRSYDRESVELVSPIERPAHVLGVGLNHRGHAQAVGHGVPDEPLFFPKPAASITGPRSQIRGNQTAETPQYEAELAVIVGKSLRNATRDEAKRAVFGYTVSNDVTAHDVQMEDISNGRPWFRSKCFETFTPLGPRVVSPETVDVEDGTVRAYLNGDLVQTLRLGDRVFDGPEILTHVSSYFTLQPGDVVLTGTADGHGPLATGDRIRITVDEIGSLDNHVEPE